MVSSWKISIFVVILIGVFDNVQLLLKRAVASSDCSWNTEILLGSLVDALGRSIIVLRVLAGDLQQLDGCVPKHISKSLSFCF